MTTFHLNYSGKIQKAEHRTAGDKPICEVSLCRKQKGRNGAEDTFCWVRCSIWQPAEFQTAKLVKGAFIAGSGELSTRAFTDSSGKNQVSLEVRCTSYDVEVSGGDSADIAPAARAAGPIRPAPAPAIRTGSDDEPPFAKSELEMLP